MLLQMYLQQGAKKLLENEPENFALTTQAPRQSKRLSRRQIITLSLLAVLVTAAFLLRKAAVVWNFAGYGWEIFLFYVMITGLRNREDWSFYRRITPRIVAETLPVLFVTIWIGMQLYIYIPLLQWSWLKILPLDHGHAINLNLMPVTEALRLSAQHHLSAWQQTERILSWCAGFGFLLLLIANLPSLAYGEELQFRDGTRNWRDGARRSVVFGLIHCIVGIPLALGLALSLGGLWFTRQYFIGGVTRSTTYHLAWNFLLMLLICWLLLTTVLHIG